MKDENKTKVELTKEVKTLRKEREESALNNITERRQIERREEKHAFEMDFLYKTALDFIQLDPKDDIYRFIGRKLKEIVGDSIVLVNSYDKASDSIQLRALEGVREKIKKVLKLIGKDLFTMSFPINNEEARNTLISGELLRIPGGLYELAFGQIPKSICHVLEKFLNVGEVYFSGFAKGKELFGDTIIILPKKVELNNREFINTFIKQSAIMLQSKQAEEELKDSEDRLKILFDYAPDAYYISDLKGNFIDGNKAAERVIGCKREELIGKSFLELKLLSLTDIPKAAKALAKNIIGKPTGPDEFALNRKDNSKVTVEISTYPVNIKGKTLILGIARDVTESKQAEEEIKSAAAKWQTTFDAMNDAVSLLDNNGIVLQCNQSYLNLLGKTETEILGKHCWEIIHGTNKPIDGCPFVKMKKSFQRESMLLPVDDKWFNVVVDPIFDANNNLIKAVHIITDITERKQAEKALHEAHDQLENKVAQRTGELQKANLRLQELDRLKTIFIASMSHELKTPLTLIISCTDIMLEKISGEINQEQKKQLTMTKNYAHHLLDLVNDAIDINKIEAGIVDMTIEEFDLSALSQEIKDTFNIIADKKELELSLEAPPTLIIESDRRRIKQILVNLLSNALKFTDKGEIKVKIAAKDKMVEIAVRDSGIGIKKEDRDKIFIAFGQIPNPDRIAEGTGLGLYLSKKNANLLGGDIMLESEFGKGSVFTLILPLKYKEDKA